MSEFRSAQIDDLFREADMLVVQRSKVGQAATEVLAT